MQRWHHTGFMAPAAGYEALEEDLNSLAALVARRPGVLEDGDTLLSAIDFADLPEDEGFTSDRYRACGARAQ
jgi:hypothetical protein